MSPKPDWAKACQETQVKVLSHQEESRLQKAEEKEKEEEGPAQTQKTRLV